MTYRIPEIPVRHDLLVSVDDPVSFPVFAVGPTTAVADKELVVDVSLRTLEDDDISVLGANHLPGLPVGHGASHKHFEVVTLGTAPAPFFL